MATFQDEVNILKERFTRDPRFEYVRFISSGAHGSAHQIRYNDPNRPGLKQFIVKKSFHFTNSQELMRTERKALEALRGCKHIVQILDIEKDPLALPPEQKEPPVGEYIIMEWIPNGTVYNFIQVALANNVVRLPNRLLWRFLYCLVRACTGMAYPPSRTDNTLVDEVPIPGVAPSLLIHGDLHAHNILLGEFLQDPDHEFSPILKLIDFGLASMEIEGNQLSGGYGVPRNLWDIGKIMVALITLNTGLLVHDKDFKKSYEFTYNGVAIKTQAHAIHPLSSQGGPLTWLDDDLAVLVSLFLASERNDRPDLFRVHWLCQNAFADKPAEIYAHPEAETDEMVKQLCESLLFAPPNKPPEEPPELDDLIL
ncbi:kinase-like domain-containing protein [Rostrohypoxylon terebratum]|nr:kinase-like domain-containing protein [Rostrohypoxylon terebratum]